MTQTPGVRPNVHQLKVTLREVRPPAWRRLLVPSTMPLSELSDLLVTTFEWDGDHLHEFDIEGRRYGPPELCDEDFFSAGVRDDSRASLHEVAGQPGQRLDYTYDLGDQ